ncbi:HlyD family efflux transporter periplasmic adaptor subunit [Rhodanobacter sp. TND4EL1]
MISLLRAFSIEKGVRDIISNQANYVVNLLATNLAASPWLRANSNNVSDPFCLRANSNNVSDPFCLEATVLNQDIGFVRPGQRATIKVESFPYTRYGYLEGVVESVTHDAIQDEKLGLIYRARVKMKKAELLVDGVKVRLTSGMALTAEIKTGKRRVIDYILDPLRQGVDESMRER